MPRPPEKFVTTPTNIPGMDWGIFPEKDEDQADWKIASAAIGALQSAPSDKPFFIACGFRLPHVPCFASERWFSLYPTEGLILPPVKNDDRDDTPRFSWFLHWKLPEPRLKWLREAGQWRPLVRAYLASISFVDMQVGRVLDTLAASGLEKDTVVVLWSDHGWHLGEKQHWRKFALWEEATRAPLIWIVPGLTKPDGVCERPVDFMSLYPTLCDLCGLPRPRHAEGVSIRPLLSASSRGRARRTGRGREWPFRDCRGRGG